MKAFKPAYLETYKTGELNRKILKVEDIMESCTLCPQNCQVNRFHSRKGKCSSGAFPIVASFNPHFGEEFPLVGRMGSGTIFFSNCNLKCVYCQNYDISQFGYGKKISYEALAEIMMRLQERGCHNINFVSPTHMIYPILKALPLAIECGLKVPLVYNSGGYDSPEILKMLSGIFDIYMPDFKYGDNTIAGKFSNAPRYSDIAKFTIKEMHRQAGDLQVDARGIAQKGLVVRHLILPGNLAATYKVIDFISGLSINTYLNIMDQYRPEYRAKEFNKLDSPLSHSEYLQYLEYARNKGLERLD
ncbi:MAG: radical SAM protein [Bacteroidales bacterium]